MDEELVAGVVTVAAPRSSIDPELDDEALRRLLRGDAGPDPDPTPRTLERAPGTHVIPTIPPNNLAAAAGLTDETLAYDEVVTRVMEAAREDPMVVFERLVSGHLGLSATGGGASAFQGGGISTLAGPTGTEAPGQPAGQRPVAVGPDEEGRPVVVRPGVPGGARGYLATGRMHFSVAVQAAISGALSRLTKKNLVKFGGKEVADFLKHEQAMAWFAELVGNIALLGRVKQRKAFYFASDRGVQANAVASLLAVMDTTLVYKGKEKGFVLATAREAEAAREQKFLKYGVRPPRRRF